jgi:hypothetical protein
VVTRLICRIKVMGQGNIPPEGGALLVANHMIFVDVDADRRTAEHGGDDQTKILPVSIAHPEHALNR